MFQRYKSYSPYDMQESIMKEVKGDLQKSFLVIGEHLSAILMKLFILYSPSFVKYLILKILVFFPSPVYWKQTAVLCQKTEWSHEGAYTAAFLFKCGCSSKKMSAVVTQVWLHRVKEPKRSCWPELSCHAVKWTWRKSVLSTRPTLESLCKRLFRYSASKILFYN